MDPRRVLSRARSPFSRGGDIEIAEAARQLPDGAEMLARTIESLELAELFALPSALWRTGADVAVRLSRRFDDELVRLARDDPDEEMGSIELLELAFCTLASDVPDERAFDLICKYADPARAVEEDGCVDLSLVWAASLMTRAQLPTKWKGALRERVLGLHRLPRLFEPTVATVVELADVEPEVALSTLEAARLARPDGADESVWLAVQLPMSLVGPRLTEWLDDPLPPALELLALRALGDVVSVERRHACALSHLDHSSPTVRFVAAEVLMSLPREIAAAHADHVRGDPEPLVRELADR